MKEYDLDLNPYFNFYLMSEISYFILFCFYFIGWRGKFFCMQNIIIPEVSYSEVKLIL